MAVPDLNRLLQRARACLREGDPAGGEALYTEVLRLAPGNAEALLNLGRLAHGAQRLRDAIEFLRRGVAADRKSADLRLALAAALLASGDVDAAVASLRRALALRPDHAGSHYLLGTACYRRDRLDEAEKCLRRALALDPSFPGANNDLGAVLAQTGRMEEAIACCRKALELKRDYPEPWNNLGGMLKKQGRLTEALTCFERAIELAPEYAAAHSNRSWLLLALGRFAEGWAEHEWRVRAVHGIAYPADPRGRKLPLPSTLAPIDLQGKRVLAARDEGLGDELFFLRYAPLLKQRGARLAHLASEKLADILGRVPAIDEVITDRDAIGRDFDLVLLAGDLPLVLGPTEEDALPPPLALAPLPDLVAEARRRLAAAGPGPYLGVAWRAGTEGRTGGREAFSKCVPPQLLAEAVGAWPGDIVVVQRAPRPEELAAFRTALARPVHDFSADNDSLEDMLALLAVLDDYATVSNTNVHLRAGLGGAARILVPHPPEWRWMATGERSPWFPQFTVYRESAETGWEPALAALTRHLAARTTFPTSVDMRLPGRA